ncbi:ribonucleoside-triphosphate reductase class III catalytic subunit [Porphyromonas gingivalis AJW4]|uniref:Anaerobic ribonucleoside triphosphate reductase n=1 Tax=Porphyromonas gingivalis TaxID=837 RepID=A0AAE9XLX2_PORGN|nr:anaerobic ribonucleoside triphosphate reductase [Porphyromonas gingivalis]ALA93233.1 ribonucleoside-triphosphate reductase class III catalytic subunit [Porphyromonas gingivalis AJW4]ATR89671.1 anaerobic ribonucleoside triphosphate reductase [Porphyromonas gingivalis]ATS05242.1 anaerobic ribonucleoside triphosphate reductase [Porphyromonas gingivalis]ETA27731.1 ribonucleoside triphosphate reductase [Porphyromonas gingivalis SJD2]MCE8179200.1 anaerobic ribonucleoside triphosphate reductase [P
MEEVILRIVKRDGHVQSFDPEKIRQAIIKAYRAGGVHEEAARIDNIVQSVTDFARQSGELVTVEQIQDRVEEELMRLNPFIAKKYIIYREWRTVERDKRTSMKHTMDGIVTIEKNDVNLGNANMSSHTPAGQMMTFASEVTKDYASKYLLSLRYSRAHRAGDIHIHDLDYYPTKTTTCVQYDIADLYERGFRTKNGSIRTPQNIHSYATLATIIFQTNQNEQHGGQAIPAFDFFMAPGVHKSFVTHLIERLRFVLELRQPTNTDLSTTLPKAIRNLTPLLTDSPQEAGRLYEGLCSASFPFSSTEVEIALATAFRKTRKDTHQAMEGFIHNLNTMHSRGGNQVVFSSINYGTDTSPEGRMVMEELLRATEEGLGHGEVPIFPIQIFKVKEGINYSEADVKSALENFDDAMAGKVLFSAPNFDLLLKACATTAKALFPNFVFLDTPFNLHEDWRADDPKRYLQEVATMGCRTRVFDNVNGPKSSIGRGNLSFTSMNLPRLAIEARHEAEENCPDGDKETIRSEARLLFLESVRRMSTLIADQLYDRYCYQRTALARQFPFMMGNDVWKGGAALEPNEEVGDVIKSGTLGIGFIGGHNAMVAIYGEGHAHNKAAWNTLYDAISVMNDVAQEYKRKYHLNYSVLATPAEGLSGRFTRMDRKRYGIIPGVTDLDYYVNSFHVDVRESIGIAEKIKCEAPFHAITGGGHITYVELDGEAKKNVSVILKIVKMMKDENIGYGSINHPVDTCKGCGFKGVIYDKCPVCGSDRIARLRRITGYLTGSLDTWNSAKQAEEHDRVKHL